MKCEQEASRYVRSHLLNDLTLMLPKLRSHLRSTEVSIVRRSVASADITWKRVAS